MCFVIVALIAAWMAAVVVRFVVSGSDTVLAPLAILVTAGLVLSPVALLLRISRRVHGMPHNWPQAAKKNSTWLLMPALPLLLVTIGTFIVYVVGLVTPDAPGDRDLTLTRLVGGGIVSPAPATLCLLGGLYAGLFAALRRSSLIGKGYTHLEKRSTAFALLNGGADASCREPSAARNGARLGDVVDMPAQNLPWTYVIAIVLVFPIAGNSVGTLSTVDGQPFGWFLAAGSATVLMFGLVNLAQGLAIWNSARAHLKWLVLSPIEGAFTSIGHLVPWDLSLAPPRLMELMPVAQRADRIIETYGGSLAVRRRPVGTWSRVKRLERELQERHRTAFMLSVTWRQLWRVSDAIVEKLGPTEWRRAGGGSGIASAGSPSGLPVLVSVTAVPDTTPESAGIATPVEMAAVIGASPESHAVERPAKDEHTASIRRCEEFLALQFAFVLRDIVARTVAALFTAMLCLTLVTAAHLLYSFNPRSALLTVDLLAVAAASLTSIWILVGMEREPVLSRLRNTTPGRVDINWPFVQRVAVYGVLPLLAVISSLFPEIGSSMFGWLEPLRKLSNF
jgi:hypothetical protein